MFSVAVEPVLESRGWRLWESPATVDWKESCVVVAKEQKH